MKKRSKPRENWESVVEISPELFEARREEIRKLLEELKIPYSVSTIGKIIRALKMYYAGIKSINQQPRMSEICAAMKKLIKYGEKYLDCLEKLDARSREIMSLKVGPDFFEKISDRNILDINIMIGQAKLVLEDWEIKKKTRRIGRPFDAPLKSFISELAKIYKEATGKKRSVTRNPLYDKHTKECGELKYSGAFFNFVVRCVEMIPDHPKKINSTLGSIIETTLKNPVISCSTKP